MKNVIIKETGRRGEDAACGFLIRAGHRIRERNWRSGHLEVDIISETPDAIHFVEVKARTLPCQAPPEENVGPVKQKRISAAALGYMHRNDCMGKEAFFDVVSVTFSASGTEIEYFPQAWIPMYPSY